MPRPVGSGKQGTAFDRLLDALRANQRKVLVTRPGQQAKASCPGPTHKNDDRDPSLSITNKPEKRLVAVNCKTGCETGELLAVIGLTLNDLYDEPKQPNGSLRRTIVAEYSYRDETGKVLFYIVRFDPKDFRPYHLTPDGHKVWNLQGVRRVLYQLPEVKQAVADGRTVWFPEGEKDVHAIESLGEVATTTPSGAETLSKCDLTPLRGAQVIATVDNDPAGEKRAQQLHAMLHDKAKSLGFMKAKTGKDAYDHIAAGYTLDELVPWWPPEPDEPEPEPEPSSWRPVDLTLVLSGNWQPPKPTVGRRSDGKGLLYPGRTHTGVGETEAGKGWFALTASADEMKDGNHVVYVDFEDDEGTVISRLLTLGIGRDLIGQQFHYIRPEDPLKGHHLEELIAVLHDYQPTLAHLDGITEAMRLHGLDPIDNIDISLFNTGVVKHFTITGAAQLSLDHVVKDRDGRGKYALGGVHKLNIVSGASYILENRRPFGIGIKGVSTIKIAKDRPGQVRVNTLPSSGGLDWYGDLVLDSKGEEYAESCIYPPIEQEQQSPTSIPTTEYMERVAKFLREKGPIDSKQLIETGVEGRAVAVRDALNRLMLDGYVNDHRPYQLLKPYPPEDQRPKTMKPVHPSQPRPDPSRDVLRDPQKPVVPVPPL
jgi:hypothetical protein